MSRLTIQRRVSSGGRIAVNVDNRPRAYRCKDRSCTIARQDARAGRELVPNSRVRSRFLIVPQELLAALLSSIYSNVRLPYGA
jgi:hypothetical protein